MKFSKWIALLQKISRFAWCAVIVLGSIDTSNCFAESPSFDYLAVTVEDISYQGSNNYRVDITIFNRSNKTIALKENYQTFYVQTKILGQWRELRSSRHGSDESIALLPQKGRHVVHILNIPLVIPALYTNNEGDINMMFKYLIRFALGSETSLRSNSGESSYWITPKTDTWILREGM